MSFYLYLIKLKQDFRYKNIGLLIKHNLKQNKIDEDYVLQLLELKNSKDSKESKALDDSFESFDSFEFNRNFQLFNLEKQLEDNLIEHKLCLSQRQAVIYLVFCLCFYNI